MRRVCALTSRYGTWPMRRVCALTTMSRRCVLNNNALCPLKSIPCGGAKQGGDVKTWEWSVGSQDVGN